MRITTLFVGSILAVAESDLYMKAPALQPAS